MRRLIWFTIGAAVGIAAYRRGVELGDDARRQGIVPTVQQTASGVMATAAGARVLVKGLTTGLGGGTSGGSTGVRAREEERGRGLS